MDAKLRFGCALLLGLALALEASAAPTNFLTNPGFETGDLLGWTLGGKHGGYGVATDETQLPVAAVQGFPGLYFESWQNVHSGNFAAYGITAGDSQEPFREYVSFAQRPTLPAGTFQLGFYMGGVTGFGTTDALQSQRLAIFVDGDYLPFLAPPPFNFPGGSSPTSFFQLVSEIALADGPHDIEFRISGSGTARTGISFDDAFVVIVPEPGGVLFVLLGSGFLILGRKLSGRAQRQSA